MLKMMTTYLQIQMLLLLIPRLSSVRRWLFLQSRWTYLPLASPFTLFTFKLHLDCPCG
ncbi:hypothetical protein M758_7G081000 [Ceratodon purpureus]|nr:hypothetical protein M758_7G081000 [Ceratodon purpureus]